MRKSIVLIAALLAPALLAGCGNKGPLVMPSVNPSPPASQLVPAATVHPAVAASAAAPPAGVTPPVGGG